MVNKSNLIVNKIKLFKNLAMKPKMCSTRRKFKESSVLITPYETLVTSGADAPHTPPSEGGATGHKTLKHRTPPLRSLHRPSLLSSLKAVFFSFF